MLRKIPNEFINNIVIQNNIIDIINNYVNLKKIGKNYKSICPFHEEKTPSFTVNEEKQFYYCFGCGSHGNVIDFLMNYEKISFIDSIKKLSIICGLENKYGTYDYSYKKEKNAQQKHYKILQKISKFYQKQLKESNNKYIHNYLNNRGINRKTIESFEIGFANSENKILKKFYYKKKYKNILIKSGLIYIDVKNNKYDFFKNRIIFPIKDEFNKTIGFGGRSIFTYAIKYINSPEHFVFKKKKILYGLNKIKKNKYKKIILVEGYIDVITLNQFNINYVVSSLGTNITKYQIELIFKYTNHVIYCYDGDLAGKKASWEALKKTIFHIKDGRNISFMFLPKQEDPDSLVRKEGKKKFEYRIMNAISLYDFLFYKTSQKTRFSSIHEKTIFTKIILSFIKNIPGKITKIFLLKKLANKVGIPDIKQLKIVLIKNKKNLKIQKIKVTKMRILISLLIQNPFLSKFIESVDNIKKIKLSGISIFVDLLNTCFKKPNMNTAQLVELYRKNNLYFIIKKLAIWDNMIKKNQIKKMFIDLIKNLHNIQLEQKINYLINIGKYRVLKKKEKQKLWLLNKKLFII
ncbi:DNA primase [Buchnera aphidicola (Taiwanaphis decaspermi)]|uniref:DNA primase n=1 Tax=Buchnera aphidicola TaxID=9 RepID=UPI0031B824BF